jgi:uncharacterized membrane protein YjjP (DUF1212 family)
MVAARFFVCLQVLDWITTLLGLHFGAAEASPFVRLLMQAGPAVGVTIAKLLALGLGGFCVYTRRFGLLRLASCWYGGVVVWNLAILLVLPGHMGF